MPGSSPPPPLTSLSDLPAQMGSAGFAVLAGFMVISAISLLPGVVDLSNQSSEAHHLSHAAQFMLGGLLALGIGSRQALKRSISASVPWWAWVAVIVAPVVMLLLMTPGIYNPLETRSFLHLLYHWGIIILGLVTGWACVRFGRVSGMAIFVMSVAMGALFAGGVGG